MWKTLWELYGKWFLICLGVTVVTLSLFFLVFFLRYDSIRQKNYDRELRYLENLVSRNQGFPADVDFELAQETIQRMRRMMDAGELDYEDFSKMRVFNQIPKHRRPMGREYNIFFEEMNLVMDLKKEGKLDQWDELVEPRRLGRTIFDEI